MAMTYVQEAFIFSPVFSIEREPAITNALGMWAAVFRQGVVDYAETMRYENGVHQGRFNCLAEDRAAVKQWFHSDATYPGSFVWLCHLFNRDVGSVRRQMRENWKTMHLPLTRAKRKETNDVEVHELA